MPNSLEKIISEQEYFQREFERTHDPAIKEYISQIQSYRGCENQASGDSIIWRLTPDGAKKDTAKSTEAERLHLANPIIYILQKNGGLFDREIAEYLNEPLFRVKHGLRALSGNRNGCPYRIIEKYGGLECPVNVPPLVEAIPVNDNLDADVLNALRRGYDLKKSIK